MRPQQLILSACLFSLLLLFGHIPGYNKQMMLWGAAAVLLCLFNLVRHEKVNLVCKRVNFVLIPLTLAAFITVAHWETWGKYPAPELQRPCFQGFGKVLIIVPHQDDDTNIAGGILSQLQKNGEVHVLFTTNGADINRLKEAIDSLGMYGIPEENIHCLGYPQCAEKYEAQNLQPRAWGEEFEHMYNLDGYVLTTDYHGNTHTLSLHGMSGCTPGQQCTRNNFKRDLRATIQGIKPDTVICIDFDIHPDHRATSLIFDECMADILRSDKAYTPFILKAFAYSTAWLSLMDFYADNLLSTQKPHTTPYMQEVNCYNWAERLRLPVSNDSLTRVLAGNKIRESFLEYASAVPNSPGMENRLVNADRVFWWRPTGNLLLHAKIVGSGKNISHLNDFKLYDSSNVSRFSQKPYTHGWCPESEQDEIHIQLEEPSVVQQIRLYDHISTENQIQKMTITLSNGLSIQAAPLPAHGAALIVHTNCTEKISGFSIKLNQYHGENAGLAEIEAYACAPQPPISIVKAVDAKDNFMYDYTTDNSGSVHFTLYTYPYINTQEFKVYHTRNGEKHALCPSPATGLYHLQQPAGSTGKIEIFDTSGALQDVVRIQNPTLLSRRIRQLQRFLDKAFLKNFSITSQKRHFRNIYRYYSKRILEQTI